MRLLFIKLKHIGDSLLLTPTLSAVRAEYPQAQIWVVVRRGGEGILAGCSSIDRTLTSAEPEAKRRGAFNWLGDLRVLRELRQQRFDYSFELSDGDRGRFLAWLSGAKTRCANVAFKPLPWWWRSKFDAQSRYVWVNGHRVEKDFYTVNEFLPLGPEIPPLAFERERTEPWSPAEALRDFAVIHPGTRWIRKRWTQEKWIELGRELFRFIPRLVVSSGPDSEEIALAGSIAKALGPAALSTQGELSWAQLAGLLYRARLFVGVDTAAMHLAAACQCPTVAIFGPSAESQWRPWQVPHRVVKPAGLAQKESEETMIQRVPTAEVAAACVELLKATGRPSGGAHETH
ncbi:MAG: glycosyltransferase family 9 protein [Verrucomicrobia bacterium]|nr:glycosyltransferase family 9 protein [Verrucomicrobiota bacterium]